MQFVPKFGMDAVMLDRFDHALLDLVQRDDSRTAESLACDVALSPSAIARRLRRLRADGWIARSIALLAPRLTETRLKALVAVQLSEHADQAGKAALHARLNAEPQVQFAYEVTGTTDMIILFDCASMAAFNLVAEEVLVADSTVRRYETSFVKHEVKFAPFIALGGNGGG